MRITYDAADFCADSLLAQAVILSVIIMKIGRIKPEAPGYIMKRKDVNFYGICTGRQPELR